MRDADDDPEDFRALDGNTIGDGPAPATGRARFGRGRLGESIPRRGQHDHKPHSACPTCGAPEGTWYRDQDHRRRFPVESEDPFALDKKATPPVIGL